MGNQDYSSTIRQEFYDQIIETQNKILSLRALVFILSIVIISFVLVTLLVIIIHVNKTRNVVQTAHEDNLILQEKILDEINSLKTQKENKETENHDID